MNEKEKALFGIDKLNIKRSEIPAVTHVDYSARIQTVHEKTNPKYYKLISAFKKKTGCPGKPKFPCIRVRQFSGQFLGSQNEPWGLFVLDPRMNNLVHSGDCPHLLASTAAWGQRHGRRRLALPTGVTPPRRRLPPRLERQSCGRGGLRGHQRAPVRPARPLRSWVALSNS